MSLLSIALLTVIFADISISVDGCAYKKFSPDHSFCKPRNPQCQITHTGLNDKEKALLLKLHNDYRSKVALGKESRAGGMPPASDMLEMEWDDELAKIAQKWAEQCIDDHDCDDCRRVDRYEVGQNLFSSGTKGTKISIEDNLRQGIKEFYDELNLFKKSIVKSFREMTEQEQGGDDDLAWGHLTQLVWAETWQIGCGIATFKEDGWDNFLLICNYGPSGNYEGEPIYKEGKACSKCPKNSCCGDDCKKFNVKASYPGLCKMHK